ncbi:Phospholipase-like [Arabidopsis thaliana x Arabidopsis arenosa]|uniref:Phospholipase-like n=1 Tax=Arabidopsis thaliana x Arabidopsis arenosa TaxID=1240361 RepID=A0A8T2B0U9_9BRAS|nr:Phospholipase-like [Arabidopsis thaliana x Arabidopsis arenosa]KAG7579408.1 Phospholipase-like [Arabidopsis thaliana x Arabidopsis arenosa]KAG7579409.1 Phospholipase-like [Arabidopsis thaliana x Arabidopsis arenosa]
MDVNRKAHPDCRYSSNPFHECASDCLEKISQGRGNKHSKKQASKILSLPGSFGKKKTESQPPSPLNTRNYQNGAANSPKIHQSRPSPVAVKKTTVPEANKSFPSLSPDEISIDLNGQHDSFNHKAEKPSRTVPLSPNRMANGGKPVSPRPRGHDHSGKNETASEISVFNVVSPPRSCANDDDDDDDENNDYEEGVELDLISVMSDSCVSVGKYRVNSSVSTILQSIIDKHGDIAVNCKLESASMRSRYLECLCSLMQELGSTPVGQLTELKVKEMVAVLKDLESVNINVGWMRSVLEEFAQYQENKDSEKERQEGLVRSKKQEMEIQEADLARIEKEVAEARLRVEEMKAELAELETERLRMEEMGFKVEKYKGKSFLDELL